MVDCADIDAWLAAREAEVPNLRDGCSKSIVWAGKAGVQTDIAVLYIHGFSATGHELRPLPDLVAMGLNANLHFTRLTGHGQDGAAMGDATFAAWRADVDEALMVANTIGKRVLVIGCSTGCTLAVDALVRGAQISGLVCISPNFGLFNKVAQLLLDLPLAKYWGPLVAGRTRSFDPINDGHAAYWTTHYPTRAVFPMGEAVRAVRRADLSQVRTPAMFAFNISDQVVSAAATQNVIDRWAGRMTVHGIMQGPADDAMGHVMAGNVFSPGQTKPLAAAILRWFGRLAPA